MTTDTKQRPNAAPPIDVPRASGGVPAVRPAQAIEHIEPDIDAEIDQRLGLPADPSGYETAIAPNFKVSVPFPSEIQEAIRAFKVVPDEMIDIKPNGQIYMSNRHASEIFDTIFGVAGWALVPVGKGVAERKKKNPGKPNEYEIITVYQNFRAYALGQYIRDVSGAGTYFSNNAEQNYSDAVEAAESYAINRFSKRLGIGKNLRDPIFAAEWIAKYAFQDNADKDNWKRRPNAGGVPLPPAGSRSWTSALVKHFTPVVGDDPEQLSGALLKMTTKAWGVDRASRSFRDLTNVEAYELCQRIGSGELAIPTISPRRVSETKMAEVAKKWPPARRDEWVAAHEGEGKPACPHEGCKACSWDEWEAGVGVEVSVVADVAAAVAEPTPAPQFNEAEPEAVIVDDVAVVVEDDEPEPEFKCEYCDDNGCSMCRGDESADDEIPPTGDRKAVSAAIVGTLCPKKGHGTYHGLFCPVCQDPSLLEDADRA